ncbi:MAG: beta-ketoacyl-[Bacteroidales bacterium]|nr:beta-ketoacyl-[acyl-carrier-protein] synthase family protein [Bacteroidales bacterium]
MRKNIVITGYGVIAAKKISKIKHLDFQEFTFPVGEVDYSNTELKNLLGIAAAKELSRTALLGIYALKQAADNAGVTTNTPGKKSLISGTTVGGMDLTEKYWQQIVNHTDIMLQHDCGSCTELTAKYFGFFDECTTISTACSSGANAILEGAEILEAGLSDIVFAGGAEALTKFHLMGFSSLMILDREVCRPFADNRAGLNLGEGAAFLVMETEEHALARGAKILCNFAGGGNACDAHHQTASSPDGEGAYRAMKQALIDANISPSDIQYVNAHGTGTVNNDASEMAALHRIFGEKMPQIESTKSITGHTTSAAGAIEAVICIKKMQENPSLRYVMDNSFGFGGNDTSIIFSSPLECGRPRPPKNITASEAACTPTIAARCEITSEDEIAEIKNYLKPAESRRMGKILKASLLTSLKALKQSGIDVPDAIITATSLGCWENSEKILDDITEPKPTLFMQSTHNTIGSNIAIYLKSHGYNITYTQGAQSLDCAMRKAALLINSGKATSVLVGLHEETTPKYRELMEKNGVTDFQAIHSVAMVVVKKNN